MMQWTNIQLTKKFVDMMQLCITCKKFGGLHLAEFGLLAGWQAGCQNFGEA